MDRIGALFVNQGAIGSAVAGHLSVEAAIKKGLEGVDDIDAEFVRLPAWTHAERLAAGAVPVLNGVDLDLHPTRWHLVEATRGKRAVQAHLTAQHSVLHVDSHTAGLRLPWDRLTTPVLLSVDATIWQWRTMPMWGRLRPYSRSAVALSMHLEARAFSRAACVVARSSWVVDGVRAARPDARVEVIHPGVDLELFRPADRTEDGLRVLFVGARFGLKGGFDLLAALAPDLGRGVTLDVVTPDAIPSIPGVRVHRLSHADPRLIRLYQKADLLCLPTHGDSFGWTLLEAMACGTPVIATPCGAIPDLLGGGTRGILTPIGDRGALRTALRRLLGSPALRTELSGAAYDHVQAHYDVRAQGRKLAELIRTTAREPRELRTARVA